MPPTTLTLTINSDDLDPVALGKILNDLHTIFREVDSELSTAVAHSLDWRVTALSYNSPATIDFTAAPIENATDIGPAVAESVLAGFRLIDESATRPNQFNDSALEALSDLSDVLNGRVQEMFLRSAMLNFVAPITKRIGANIDLVLTQGYSIGAIEGQAEGINIHSQPYFTVYDAVTARAVRCFFDKGAWMEILLSAIGKKVSVAGMLRRDPQGRPNQLRQITQIEILSDPSESVPNPELVGNLPDIGDTRDYLAMIRGE